MTLDEMIAKFKDRRAFAEREATVRGFVDRFHDDYGRNGYSIELIDALVAERATATEAAEAARDKALEEAIVTLRSMPNGAQIGSGRGAVHYLHRDGVLEALQALRAAGEKKA